ncbi:MAG TPA: glycoside hydrolase family 3 N-terminal domain-containing protein, partial [Polyangiaceae bacterium]|nr:glycoside hydrolase family 3 N-terminal domain-containing protein [Polyangiaceae bacterium]
MRTEFVALAVLSLAACTHPSLGLTTGTQAGSSNGVTPFTMPGTNGSSTSNGSSSTQPGASGGSSTTGNSEAVVVNRDMPDMQVARMSCGDSVYSDDYTPGYTNPPDARVQQRVNSMTLAQKATQMRGTSPGAGNASNYSDILRTLDDTDLGLRGYQFRDGPRGVNLEADLPSGKNGYSTAFPVSAARGASFDLDLEYQIGEAMGDETLASGNTMLLAPCVNVLRHPAWGRSQETYGEDPYLLGRIGSAFTAGLQQYVAGCAKHFAANNIEINRSNLNAQMDEQTLREIYGRHFKMIVQDGGVACVMASYNLINGTKSTLNQHLLTEMLRDDFGFRGFVLSDWWAMPPGQSLPAAAAAQDNTRQAVNAGLDMELPWSLNFAQLESVVGNAAGQIPLSEVNTSVSRILEQKYRFGVAELNEPLGKGMKTPTTTLGADGSIQANDAHIALAQEAAARSMVLLKNDNATLPIKQDGSIKNVAVIGASVPYVVTSDNPSQGTINFATDARIGDRGSSRVKVDPAQLIGPFAGISAFAAANGGKIQVTNGTTAAAAQNADFVVVVVGLTPQDEGEEYTGAGDRTTFALDGKTDNKQQDQLVKDVAALGKPMVVVIEAGSVIDMPWLAQVPAVVMAWYPGQKGGAALADLLFGTRDFGGKLPISWPKSWDDLPTFNGGATTVMDYYLGYRYFDNEQIQPLFP